MKKRMMLVAAAALAVMCGTGAAASDEEATLRVLNWGNTEEESIANDAIARFNEEYPNVKVEQTCVPVDSWSDFVQKWITMTTSGEAPDVISLGLEAAQMAVSNDLLAPLDDIVAADEELSDMVTNEYAQSLLEGFSVDGKLYGLPNGTQTMVMYYNKKLFDEKGVEYPKEGWTWDEFMDTAKAMTFDAEDGTKVYGYGLSSSYFQLTPWWVTNGAYPTDEEGKPALNSPAMVESVEFLKSMVDEGVTPDPISSDVYTMFSSRQLAMVGAGRWVLNSWQDSGFTADDFDCVQWPQKTQQGSVYGGSAWCISSQTEHQDLAIALMKAMVDKETLTAVAAGGQQVPPTASLATDTEIMGTVPDNIMGIWEAVTIASPVDAPTYFGDLEQTTLRSLENVFSGAMSVQDALDQGQAEIESAIG